MKKVLTVRSLVFNSLLVLIFAACGANAHKKAQICSNIDSAMFLPENDSMKNRIEDNSDPMFLPKEPNFNEESHPMVISPCS